MRLLKHTLLRWLKQVLPTLIFGLAAYLLTLLPDRFYDFVGISVGYKVLLILCTLSLFLTCYLLDLYLTRKPEVPLEIGSIVQQLTKVQDSLSKSLDTSEVKLIRAQLETLKREVEKPTLLGAMRAEADRSRKEGERIHQEIMDSLSGAEKEQLKKYIDDKTKDMILSQFDGTALGLEKKGVLFISSEYPDYQLIFNMNDWAWKLLRAKPNLLK